VSFPGDCVGDDAAVTVGGIFFGAEKTVRFIDLPEPVEQQGAGGLDERPIALFPIFKTAEQVSQLEKMRIADACSIEQTLDATVGPLGLL
jgi:hypothetical protein